MSRNTKFFLEKTENSKNTFFGKLRGQSPNRRLLCFFPWEIVGFGQHQFVRSEKTVLDGKTTFFLTKTWFWYEKNQLFLRKKSFWCEKPIFSGKRCFWSEKQVFPLGRSNKTIFLDFGRVLCHKMLFWFLVLPRKKVGISAQNHLFPRKTLVSKTIPFWEKVGESK